MLDVLRRNAGSWAIKFILSFIALTFIWWGVGSYSESRRDVAATVGEEKVTMAELAEAVAGLEKVYRTVYGNAFTPEMARSLDLRRQALDTLIRRKILISEAGTMGLAASTVEVQREISSMPAFQQDGRFSEDLYRNTLAYNRVTASEYEAAKREEITVRKMEGVLSASARVPETEARDLFDLSFRKTRLLVVVADPARRKAVAPAEGDIAAKYEQTRESYRIPARVKLSAARFSPDAFARRVELTEQEILSFYEGNSDKFRTEESRLVHPVSLPYGAGDRDEVRGKAEELLAEGNRGKEQFEAAARKHSRGKSGELWVKRSEMRPELADAVFSAPVDGMVGPIDSGGGFTIVRVNRIRFPESLPLEQVRDRAAALLRREKGKDLAVIRAYEAHGKAMESKDLAGACAPFGIVPEETGWISDGQGGEVPAPVVQEALLLRAGEIGPVKSVGETHYLFRVTDKENSRIPPLAEVRERVAAAVAKERREAAARAELEAAISGAKTASDLERNARRAGLEVSTTPFFSPLSGPLPGILPAEDDVRKAVVGLSAKNPVSSRVFPAGTRFLSFAFVEEKPAGREEWEARKESFLRDLAEQKRNRVIEAFVADRMKQARVEINPEALK